MSGKSKRRLVVIGHGMAGQRLCERLQDVEAEDFFELTVFDEIAEPMRQGERLSGDVSGQLSPVDAVDFCRGPSVALHYGEGITRIDRAARRVETATSSTRYDQLVIATGARTRMPAIPGIDLPGVFGLGMPNDWQAIRERAGRARSAAVLGGGAQGLMAAQSLCELGLETHLLESAPRLMHAHLDAASAGLLKTKMENLGIVAHLPARVTGIAPCHRGRELAVQLSGGHVVDVDLVVTASGVTPRDKLAYAAGLQTDSRGGIQVNERCQTSDPNIFAIGECAAHLGRVHSFADSCYEMADVVAKNLLGCRETFSRADWVAALKLRSVEVMSIGASLNEVSGGSIRTYKRQGVCRNLILEEGYLVGAIAVGPWPESAAIREAVQQRRRVMPWQLVRFRRTGQVFRHAERGGDRSAKKKQDERPATTRAQARNGGWSPMPPAPSA